MTAALVAAIAAAVVDIGPNALQLGLGLVTIGTILAKSRSRDRQHVDTAHALGRIEHKIDRHIAEDHQQ